MNKLPASTLAKLKSALSSGKIPDHGQPGYDDLFDIWPELVMSISGEWENPSASAARREVSALTDFHNVIPFDGLLVGVAANQPAVVAAAINAAKSMNLSALGDVLARIAPHITEQVLQLVDPVDRFNWYQSPQGEKHAEALASLEDEAQEGDIVDELLLGCCRRVLNEPDQFFE